MPSAFRVSVVLTCLNEKKNLARVVEALLVQNLTNDAYEVVVMDGGSVKGSVELTESMGVRVVHSSRGVSVQRNRGAVRVV